MTDRIDKVFSDLRKAGKKAFISYVTGGDPNMAASEKIILSLARSGVDIMEIGIPFSDPVADGPVIQRAVKRSLAAGCTVEAIFDMVKKIRKRVETPIVFMTYYNILYRRGIKKFVKDAANCGADGLIVPDLPLEESAELRAVSDRVGISLIMLTSPTTDTLRLKKISNASSGFIYHVSITGVTGVRSSVPSDLKKQISAIKKVSDKPVCAGFGISSPRRASEIARYCDGVIAGSAIILEIEKDIESGSVSFERAEALARKMADAVHRTK